MVIRDRADRERTVSDSSDGGSSDSGSSSDSSSSDSSWSSDTSSSDNAWTDTSTSDASGSGTSWSGGEQDTTWGDPFPSERPADLPSDLLSHDPADDAGWAAGSAPTAGPDAAAEAQAAKEEAKAALAAEGEAAPWAPPDAPPPPPAWTTGQMAPASPPSSPGYSPYPTHPTYPTAPGGPPPAGYPSAYGGAAPPPTGFPPSSAMPGQYPGAYPPAYAPAAPGRTNGFAAASLAVAITGVFLCFAPVLSILAVVFGHVARGRITRSQGAEGGKGLATAGLIIGYLTLVLSVGFWVLVVVSAEPVPDGDPPSSIAEFGTDPVLDDLARDCAGEDFAACDRLWLQSDRGSGYEDYGASCGGRVTPDPTESDVFHERCTEQFDGDGTPA